jgi:hypothetical protein
MTSNAAVDIINSFYENINVLKKGTKEEPLFRTNDIGTILDISNIRSIVKDFDPSEKILLSSETNSGEQTVSFLTKKGLYNLLFISRHPIAKTFKLKILDDIATKSVDHNQIIFDTFETTDVQAIGEASFGSKTSFTIYRNGDCIEDIFLNIHLQTLPDGISYINNLGYNIIHNVKLDIGGQRIIQYCGDFVFLNEQLLNGPLKNNKHMFISDNQEELKEWSNNGTVTINNKKYINLIIPLKFFKIPLYALKYHEVNVIVEFKYMYECIEPNFLTDKSDNINNFFKNDIAKLFKSTELIVNYSNACNLSFTGSEVIDDINIQQMYYNREYICDIKQNFKIQTLYNIKYIIVSSYYKINYMSLTVDGKIFLNEKSGLYYNEVVPKCVFKNGYLPKNTYVIPFISSNNNTHINFNSKDLIQLNCVFDSVSDKQFIDIFMVYENSFRCMSGMGGMKYPS